MTHYSLTHKNGVITLELRGHASSVAHGPDPVCAAVSALVFTLAAETEELYKRGLLKRPPHLVLCPGDAHISVLPTSRGRAAAESAFSLILRGLDLISESYGDCVEGCGKE